MRKEKLEAVCLVSVERHLRATLKQDDSPIGYGGFILSLFQHCGLRESLDFLSLLDRG